MLEKWLFVSTKYPLCVLTVAVVLNAALFVVTVIYGDRPNFDDPLLGFEARGSQLSNKINTWKLFAKSDRFTAHPSNGETLAKSEALRKIDEEEEEKLRLAGDNRNELNKRMHFDTDTFCGKISEENVQIVVEAENDLLSLDSLLTLCNVDKNIFRIEDNSNNSSIFTDSCEITKSGECCPSWSLPNYVAFISNKSDCWQLNETDVHEFKELLRKCRPHYTPLSSKCLESSELCGTLPKICHFHKKTLFTIFHYLIDENSLSLSADSEIIVKTSNVFLPIAKSSDLTNYFNQLIKNGLKFNQIKIVAMDLGMKYSLFETYLISDLKYVAIALIIIVIIIVLHTRSLFITFFVLFTMSASFTTAYFIYIFVYKLSFFPFINLLAVIVCVAIGSDSALIFMKYFMHSEPEIAPETLRNGNFRRAVLSTFIASLTTAFAFFAAFSTKITAIKCFSLFSGTVVVCNFFLTVICLPAAIQCSYCYFNCEHISPLFTFKLKKLTKFISILSISLMVVFVILVVLSAIVVFVTPKLRISNSEVFQLFEEQHLFERYDFNYKRQFMFWQSSYKSDSDFGVPVRIVFGLKPEDNGSPVDPRDRGSLVFSDNFNISIKAQKFLFEFCKQFKNQSYYKPMTGPLLRNCFVETLRSWLNSRKCWDSIDLRSRYPCCDASHFPYNKNVIDVCLKEAMSLIHVSSKVYMDSKWAGVWYEKNSSKVSVAVIEYNTNFQVNNSFLSVDHFWQTVNSWTSYVIENFAPQELKDGFAITDYLETYAFQEVIISGTQLSVCIALASAFVSIALSTLDERLTFAAVFTIGSIILNTIAVLVLLGWRINVIESICICIAIGLSVDSTMHYTMAFKLSRKKKRNQRVTDVLIMMLGPVTVSNLTTLITGCVIRLSIVLPYRQFGDFLIVISLINWLYSTLFFVPLASICIPKGENR